jgi:uncharacterized protein YprB with RNaseH-like and TPR domain
MSPRKENYKSKNLLENSDTHNSLNRAKSLGKEQFRKIEPLRIDPSGEKDHSKTIGLFGRIDSFGCYDFETFPLEDGLQRAYYLLVYHPLKGYTHFRRCDYSSEIQFNNAILKFFRDNPSIYFSFNGRNFDHLILNRILNQSGVKPFIWIDKSKIRKLSWFNNTFLDILYWTHPCTFERLIKDLFERRFERPISSLYSFTQYDFIQNF